MLIIGFPSRVSPFLFAQELSIVKEINIVISFLILYL